MINTTFQINIKNRQSYVVGKKKCAFFLADTVHWYCTLVVHCWLALLLRYSLSTCCIGCLLDVLAALLLYTVL
jgi:hypothetical protein